MQLQIRRSNERGSADHGWLKSKHTFSFAEYYDPQFMGFGPLRVINEDIIAGGSGFATHGHRDMEIISYVVKGALRHKDSMGNEAVIRVGDVQRMTAGTGVRHSEYNDVSDQDSHFLQIWILPETQGLAPSYEQKSFNEKFKNNSLVLVASRDGREDSLTIHQDADMYVCRSERSGSYQHSMRKARHVWIQVVKGVVEAGGHKLSAGDGLSVTGATELSLSWSIHSEFLLFDLG